MAHFPVQLSVLQRLWCVEAIRLKEEQWGPLADEAELRRARGQGTDLTARIELRAQYLCERLGWLRQQQTILRYGRWIFYAWIVLAIVVGMGIAQAALGFGTPRVNIMRAWFVLLGVPSLGMILWGVGVINYLLRRNKESRASRPWRWVIAKLARGPDGPLLIQALFNVLQRQGLLFWLFSSIHHVFWGVALGVAALRLWLLFAFKRYFFQWETTLLDGERFVALAQAASTGLRWLGIPAPDEQFIRLSDGLAVLPASGHAVWASWLIACVLVYGWLPRLILGGLSMMCYRYVQRTAHVDSQQPGLVTLLPRLGTMIEPLGIDKPSSPDQVPKQKEAAPRQISPSLSTVVVGMELAQGMVPAHTQWPAHWQWFGVVDSRQERQAFIDHLQQQPPEHVVMLCDGQQTPDRGLMAWLVEVSHYADNETVVVELPITDSPERAAAQKAWQQRLEAAGLSAVYFSFDSFLQQMQETTSHDHNVP